MLYAKIGSNKSSVSNVEHFVSYRGSMAMTPCRDCKKICRPSLVMVTCQYEWKILEWDVKHQNKYQKTPKFKLLLPRMFGSNFDWKRRSCEVVFNVFIVYNHYASVFSFVKGCGHLSNTEFPLPDNVLCKDWLKYVQCSWIITFRELSICLYIKCKCIIYLLSPLHK